jgi:Cu+-exporting ATPase
MTTEESITDDASSPTWGRSACCHCGEPCPDPSLTRAEKAFCCHGCLVVYDLLTESGLGHFYDLGPTPGTHIGKKFSSAPWIFLDEPALAERLLDFTDDRQSKVTLHVPAIHCIACVWLLENLFRLHPGIERSEVNFARREAAITFRTGQIKLSELVALLGSLGYEPELNGSELDKTNPAPGRKRAWLQIGVAGFAFGNIMLFSIPQYFGLDQFHRGIFKTIFGVASLALALPVVIFSASDYWRSALLAVRRRQLTLEVPIAIGLAAIYGQSAWEIFNATGEGYCDSLTGLIFFLLCGRAFQARTQERMAFDRDYKSFLPLAVTRKIGAAEKKILLSQLQVGDRVLIRNGELIPADARLVSGPAFVDYSFVTGESALVEKSEGDHLYAGGRQSGGAIEIETVKAVSQSYLMSLWNHEAFRKDRDDNFNTLTNRYSRRFTFVVVSVALLAAVFWIFSGNFPRGLKAFTSVLIVACPCALALAAPFTLGTAQRWLARLDVFLRNALILERLAKVDAIVFDKTGTLTAAGGKAITFDGSSLNETERHWMASLARHSTHPHSVSIAQSFEILSAPESVSAFRETPGSGIEGTIQGHSLLLGSIDWLGSRGVRLTKTPGTDHTAAVHLAIDSRHRAAFRVSGTLRRDLGQLFQKLAGRYDLALLSGDNAREREAFRALLGSSATLKFNQSPIDKLGFIQHLQQSGRTVMMVGDGLNDAGALRQADVGVAVVEEIGVFSPASDVILAAGRVAQLFEILALARRSAALVRISFGISSLYNCVGISIAAAGLLSPLTCAVLMPLSSVSVVLFSCTMTSLAARKLFEACARTATPFAAQVEGRTSTDLALVPELEATA